MSKPHRLDDLDLTSLVSSRICHDLAGAIGAINNGLEVLDSDDDPSMREFALNTIRNSAKQAWAHLEYSRLAFGAAGGKGSEIALSEAKRLAEAYLGEGRHRLIWQAPEAAVEKNRVKLILNLVAIGQQTLLRGGEIRLEMQDDKADRFQIICEGEGARLPDNVQLMMPEGGTALSDKGLTSRDIQAYFSGRVAQATGLKLKISNHENQVVFSAEPMA